MMQQDPSGIYCDENRCLGRNECASYKGKLPEMSFQLSNRGTYTVPGDDLLSERVIVDHTGEYLCEILLFNSGDYYLLGAPLLKNFYSVYDIDNYKMGLGRVIDFDAPIDAPVNGGTGGDIDSPDAPGQQESEENDYTLRNALIFSGIAAAFLVFACIVCKRRRDEARSLSGTRQAKRARKHLKLTEDDPNLSLVEGQEANSTLRFVEASDDENGDAEIEDGGRVASAEDEEETEGDALSDAGREQEATLESEREIDQLLGDVI